MGIERIAAPVSQAQRQTIRGNISEDDIVELAGSRKPPKTLQKERGVWSFLTSPFVLGSIVVAEALRQKTAMRFLPRRVIRLPITIRARIR